MISLFCTSTIVLSLEEMWMVLGVTDESVSQNVSAGPAKRMMERRIAPLMVRGSRRIVLG